MPDTAKNKKPPPFKVSGTLNTSIGNYADEPFFLNKAEEAKKILKKAGLPKKANPGSLRSG